MYTVFPSKYSEDVNQMKHTSKIIGRIDGGSKPSFWQIPTNKDIFDQTRYCSDFKLNV